MPENIKAKIRDLTAGIGAVIGGAAGDSSYNAQLAGVIGQNAVENNNTGVKPSKRGVFVYIAKKLVNKIAPEKSADPSVVANYWLRQTDKSLVKQIDFDHIAKGHISVSKDGKTRAVGFHHEPSGAGVSKVSDVTQKPNDNGVWKAKVEVFDPKTQTWVKKQSESTFFPSGWTKERLDYELSSAFKNGYSEGLVKNMQSFVTTTPSGVRVKFVPPAGNVDKWRGWPLY